MNHIVAAIADAAKVTLPIRGILAHELADHREYGESWQWQGPAVQLEPRRDINVVEVGLLVANARRGALRILVGLQRG
jgi:hypothetical protein